MTCIKIQNLSSVNQPTGFTLVELIVVILLTGILSISIAPRFFGASSYKDRKAVDEILVGLRHAQQMAMNRGGNIEFILAATNFTVQVSGGTQLRSPEGLYPYRKNLPAGITATTATVRFNGLGEPVNASGMPVTTNQTLNISSQALTVEAETGYAH